MKTRVIECSRRMVNLEIGSGNRLILFQGDKLTVSIQKTVRDRFRVIDSSGHVIGYITGQGIHCITNQPLRKRKNVALAQR